MTAGRPDVGAAAGGSAQYTGRASASSVTDTMDLEWQIAACGVTVQGPPPAASPSLRASALPASGPLAPSTAASGPGASKPGASVGEPPSSGVPAPPPLPSPAEPAVQPVPAAPPSRATIAHRAAARA